MARVRFELLSALALAFGLAACGANCLRDSDCNDTEQCVRDQCVRPSLPWDAGSNISLAGRAGEGGMMTPSYPGLGGAAGTGGAGGAGGTRPIVEPQGGSAGGGMAGSFGGSATPSRENLDASTDADAAINSP
jgi:hypothetical protein